MSNPPNQLSEFQSHTAMHILIMCDGMKTAELLRTDPSAFVDNTDDPEQLFDTHTIEDSFSPGFKGRYIVVFDGRRNANYSIESAKWSTTLSPIGSDFSSYNQVETEGTIEIEEPFGIEFLETLVKGSAALEVVPAGVVYMLKTFFIGFDGNGNQQIVDNVLPFTFTILDLKAEMKAMGSKYELSVMGTSNGISKLPQVSGVAEGLKGIFAKDEQLSIAIASVQDSINSTYKEFKKLMVETLQEEINGSDLPDISQSAAELVDSKYSDVEYRIILDPEYKNESYKIGTNEGDSSFADDDNFQIAFGTDATVEECIHTLLKTCSQIEEDSVVQDGETISRLPKISTRLAPSDDNSKFIVEYTVNRQTIQHQELGAVYVPNPGEFIEFDYIYTGKNIDILEMDMKMQMGLTFLNTRVSATPIPSTNEDEEHSSISTSVPTSHGDPHNAEDSVGTDKEPSHLKSPLFLGAKIKPQHFANKVNIAATTTFEESLARQSHLENLQAQIKIVGNPQLLNESLSEADDGSIPSAFNTGLSNMYKRPGLVKININFPSTKELTGVKKFWYDGYFRIFKIENEFNAGVFTQTLDLFSLLVVSKIPKKLATLDSKLLPNPGVKIKKYEVNRADQRTEANQTTRALKFGRLRSNDNGNGDTRRDPTVDIFAKSGAVLTKVGPEISNIYDEIVDVWKKHTGGDPSPFGETGVYANVVPVITSGNDSTHKVGSLHGKWLAIDLRANNLSANQAQAIEIGRVIARDLSVRIGNEYDVIYENYVGNFGNNHIHLEYDPKPLSTKRDFTGEV